MKHLLPAGAEEDRAHDGRQGIADAGRNGGARQHHAEAKSHRHHQGKILPGFLMPALADLSGHQGIAAAAEHHAQRRRQIGHGHGDIDGGQGVRVYIEGHEDAVHRGIQICKNA